MPSRAKFCAKYWKSCALKECIYLLALGEFAGSASLASATGTSFTILSGNSIFCRDGKIGF